jgi:uncharacterized repeat protein (TIGR03803 family)
MLGFLRAFCTIVAGLVAASVAPIDGQARTLKTIYDFCAQASCADGQFAGPALTIDPAGAFYGAAGRGGAHNEGVVFRMVINKNSGRAS